MKKLICLLLAIIFTFVFATMAMATDDIDDPLAAQSPDTVTTTQYDEIDEFDDDSIPESGSPEIEIPDEVLPQTGGIPAEVFYVVGGICILGAVLLLGRKSKPSTK